MQNSENKFILLFLLKKPEVERYNDEVTELYSFLNLAIIYQNILIYFS